MNAINGRAFSSDRLTWRNTLGSPHAKLAQRIRYSLICSQFALCCRSFRDKRAARTTEKQNFIGIV